MGRDLEKGREKDCGGHYKRFLHTYKIWFHTKLCWDVFLITPTNDTKRRHPTEDSFFTLPFVEPLERRGSLYVQRTTRTPDVFFFIPIIT